MMNADLQAKINHIKAMCRAEAGSNQYALSLLTAIEGLEDWDHLSPVQITLEVIADQLTK